MLAGTFRVEITATRKTGKQVMNRIAQAMDPAAENALVDPYGQFIPTHYNQQSEPTAEVTEPGPNRTEFALNLK